MKAIFKLLLFVVLVFGLACSNEDDPFAYIAGPDSVAEAYNMDGDLLNEMLNKTQKGEFGENSYTG